MNTSILAATAVFLTLQLLAAGAVGLALVCSIYFPKRPPSTPGALNAHGPSSAVSPAPPLASSGTAAPTTAATFVAPTPTARLAPLAPPVTECPTCASLRERVDTLQGMMKALTEAHAHHAAGTQRALDTLLTRPGDAAPPAAKTNPGVVPFFPKTEMLTPTSFPSSPAEPDEPTIPGTPLLLVRAAAEVRS